ncbi:unnamed protein product, partial [Allacma fusca]
FKKLRIILSLLSASHLVFDPIIRIMKGGFTTVMVGSFLLTILSNIANSTHSSKLCDSSLDCHTGLLCSPDRLLCVCTSACFDCGQLKRMSRSNCTAKSSDCGSCLPGTNRFVPSWEGVHCEDSVATERLRGSHSTSPWNIIFATVAITAALSVCAYWYVLALVSVTYVA